MASEEEVKILRTERDESRKCNNQGRTPTKIETAAFRVQWNRDPIGVMGSGFGLSGERRISSLLKRPLTYVEESPMDPEETLNVPGRRRPPGWHNKRWNIGCLQVQYRGER